MSQHRQLKKAKLIDLQEEAKKMRQKALSHCRMISPLIDPSLVEIVDMDIVSAADAMDELVMLQAELLSLNMRIKTLEEELYS